MTLDFNWSVMEANEELKTEERCDLIYKLAVVGE